MALPALATGMALIDRLVQLFRPVNRLVDEIHTSDEERAHARATVLKLQNESLALALALEQQRLESQASLIAAEANGASWLQRNWRPITMLSFLGLVIADAFGLLAFRLADQAWLLLQIGLGGYVVGRSVEKISPQIHSQLHAPLPQNRAASKGARSAHSGKGADVAGTGRADGPNAR